MKSRLFKKLFLTSAGIFIATLTVLSAILSFVVVNNIITDKKDTLTDSCKAVVTFCEKSEQEEFVNKEKQISKMLIALSRTSDANIFVTDQWGNITACNCKNWQNNGECHHSFKSVSQDILNKISKNGYFETGHLGGFYPDNTYFTAALKIENDTQNSFVFASLPDSQTKRIFLTFFRMYLLTIILPVLLMFFAEYAFTYRITKPLRQMSYAAKRMAMGDFSQRIPVYSDDEIADLSISFNNMTNSLVKLESTRRSFVANVSHELRTPMTTIGGFIDGILDGTIAEDDQKHYLKIVSGEIKRLSRLVESMLCLARLESGELKINNVDFDIFKVARDVFISQEARISSKQIEIFGLQNEKITVSADYDLIYQVIYNIIDNAIKFTPDGGTITLSYNRAGGFLEFAVKNSGSYISKEDCNEIFDRFFKVDKSRSENKGGTGLGLYIAKTIINIHGGKISVSSDNNGTEFSFTLPDNNRR